MKRNLIIQETKVKRIPETLSVMARIKPHLTARNAIGFAGIVAFAVWMVGLFVGGR